MPTITIALPTLKLELIHEISGLSTLFTASSIIVVPSEHSKGSSRAVATAQSVYYLLPP